MTPYYQDDLVRSDTGMPGTLAENAILLGDCRDVMTTFDDCFVDAIITDPPYDLLTMSRNGSRRINNPDTPAGRSARGFMNKAWDGTGVAFDERTWLECLRVAKPGAHLIAFGGTRTYHRMTVAIEDAGWEIRDCLVWGYASGFPKSLNVGDGWGTALKPAWEPIVLARKPLIGTVAANRERHGTGALNIDETRIPFVSASDAAAAAAASYARSMELGAVAEPTSLPTVYDKPPYEPDSIAGRWPANVVLTDPIFDGGVEGVVGGGDYGGTYSRFFLIPKADRSEREPFSMASFEARREQAHRKTGPMDTPYLRGETMRKNTHPTVKPVDLMRHLVRLVTPPGGLVLDPFLGSGTTVIAAEMEGFRWLGIEQEAEYVAIAEARLNGVQRGLGLTG